MTRTNLLMRTFAAFLLASLLAGAADSSSTTMAPESVWAGRAKADIESAFAATFANHPGTYDAANPDFKILLQTARQRSLILARQAQDAAGYRAALERFSSILGDGHAGINIRLTPEQLPANRWPGFVAVWRGEGLYVYRSTDAKLTPGTEFIGCDGRSMHALVLSNVFAFRGQPTQPGQWWTRARSLFIDRGNPFATLPQQCQIRRAGQILSIQLGWRATDATFEKWRDESYNGDVRPVGISTPSEGVTWIAMPTFEPDEKQRAT